MSAQVLEIKDPSARPTPHYSGPRRVMFGVGHELSESIVGVPEGARVRVKQRQDDFVMVFVRTPNRIEQWAVRMDEFERPTLYAQQATTTW